MNGYNIDVKVNLKENKAIITITYERRIFNKWGYFPIESDSMGFSRIAKKDGKYYLENYLYSRKIEEKEISEKEVIDIIKDVLSSKEGDYE